MNYRQRMRRIVLPQAIRVVIPPTGNEFIAMMKDSALISLLGSLVSQMEIFRRAQLVGRADFRPLEAFVVAAVLYWILTTVFQYFQTKLEKRLSTGFVRITSQPGVVTPLEEPT
jgi:polar amino acid transport system permease protein